MTQPQSTIHPKIIGLNGHAGVGKDTAADYLQDRYSSVYIHAFADPLKEACAKMFGIDLEAFYNPAAKEQLVNPWNVTPRMIAQFVGTELVREHMWKLLKGDTDNFWIRHMEAMLASQLFGRNERYDKDDIVIIPDVRFQNEYDWIMTNNGYVIHLTRPGYEGKIGIPGHKSEAGIQFTQPERTYLVCNDSTLETFHTKVDNTFRDICEKHFFPSPI